MSGNGKTYYVVRGGDYASSKTHPYFTDDVRLAERMTMSEVKEFVSQFEEPESFKVEEAA